MHKARLWTSNTIAFVHPYRHALEDNIDLTEALHVTEARTLLLSTRARPQPIKPQAV